MNKLIFWLKIKSDFIFTVLFCSIILYITFQISEIALFHPNGHTDNLYNLGVILRSAKSSSHYLLESSYLHWYFEDINIVRVEDWHRGLSLLAQRYFAQYISSEKEWLLRMPHLLWIIVWMSIVCIYYFKTVNFNNNNNKAKFICGLGLIMLYVLLLINGWSPHVLSAAYMDDVPGAVFALIGIYFLLNQSLDIKHIIFCAVGLGLSFLAKDFYLFLSGIGGLLVLMSCYKGAKNEWYKYIIISITYITFLLLIYSPKLIWNYVETDHTLSTSARTAYNARLMPGGDQEHSLYVFTGHKFAISYYEVIKFNGISNIISEGWGKTLNEIKKQRYTWLLFLLALVPYFAIRRSNPVLDRVFSFIVIIFLSYFMFFVLQLGEASQTRYWLVPISLVVVFFVSCMTNVLILNKVSRLFKLTNIFIIIMVIAMMYQLYNEFQKELKKPFTYKNYSNNVEQYVIGNLDKYDAILLHTNRGVHLWSKYSNLLIASVKPHKLIELTPDQFDNFIRRYNIEIAVFSANLNSIEEFFTKNGFEVAKRFNNDIVYIRK